MFFVCVWYACSICVLSVLKMLNRAQKLAFLPTSSLLLHGAAAPRPSLPLQSQLHL